LPEQASAEKIHLPAARSNLEGMQAKTTDTRTWPDLAISLYDKLTGRGAEITYEFCNLEISVPSSAAPDAEHAVWRVSGTVKIRTRDDAAAARA
jgi:hypothetical protein